MRVEELEKREVEEDRREAIGLMKEEKKKIATEQVSSVIFFFFPHPLVSFYLFVRIRGLHFIHIGKFINCIHHLQYLCGGKEEKLYSRYFS